MSAGCASSLPRPVPANHVPADFTEVPYPPPPAKVQVVPKAPSEEAVWVNGEWFWRGNGWSWEDGGWVIPPHGARFAPWTTRWKLDGVLLFAPGTWVLPNGQRIRSSALLRPGRDRWGDHGIPLCPPEESDRQAVVPAQPSGRTSELARCPRPPRD